MMADAILAGKVVGLECEDDDEDLEAVLRRERFRKSPPWPRRQQYLIQIQLGFDIWVLEYTLFNSTQFSFIITRLF